MEENVADEDGTVHAEVSNTVVLLPGATTDEQEGHDRTIHTHDWFQGGSFDHGAPISRSTSSPDRLSGTDKLFVSMPRQVRRKSTSLPSGTEIPEAALHFSAKMALYGVAPVKEGRSAENQADASQGAAFNSLWGKNARPSPSIRHAPDRKTAVSFMLGKITGCADNDATKQRNSPKGSFQNLFQNKVRDVMQMKEATAWIRMKKQMSFYGHHAHGGDRAVPWLRRVLEPDDVFVLVSQAASLATAAIDVFIMFMEGASFTGCPDCGDPSTNESLGTRAHLGRKFWWFKLVLGLISDVVGVHHVFLSFRISADASLHSRSAKELKKQFRGEVRMQYLRSKFLLDALGALPVYWIFMSNPWVRMNRLLRFIRVNVTVLARVISSMIGLNINMQLIRIFYFLFLLAFWVHIISCCTMIVTWHILDEANGEQNVGLWFARHSVEDFYDWGLMYLQALLWTCSIVAGFGGEWAPQTSLSIVWTLVNSVIGVFMYMYIFGEIVSILQNFDLTAAEFNSKRDMVTTFLRIREVPKDTRIRVHKYFDTLWQHKHGMDEKAVLASLPPFLQHDVAWQLNSIFLEKVPMFLGADPAALMEINKYLVHTVATAGEFVVRKDEICEDIGFVIGGYLHIMDENGEVECELYEGSVCGEVSVLLDMPAPHDIQAKTACDFLTLSLSDFQVVADAFPGLRAKLEHRASIVYGKRWKRWKLEQDMCDENELQDDGAAKDKEVEAIKYAPRIRRSSIDSTISAQNLAPLPRFGSTDAVLARNQSDPQPVQYTPPILRSTLDNGVQSPELHAAGSSSQASSVARSPYRSMLVGGSGRVVEEGGQVPAVGRGGARLPENGGAAQAGTGEQVGLAESIRVSGENNGRGCDQLASGDQVAAALMGLKQDLMQQMLGMRSEIVRELREMLDYVPSRQPTLPCD